MKTKTMKIKKWLPLFVLIIVIAGIYISGLHKAVTLDTLQQKKDILQGYASEHPVFAALGFIGLYITATALSLPIATFLTLLGGFLFGAYFGTAYVVIAATLGATLLFLIARSSIGETLRDKAGPLYQKVEKNMQENAAGYMLFMRLVPVFPFFLVNILPALFNVSLISFMWTTLIGILPGSFVFVNLGRQLADIESLNDLVSTQTFVAFGLLGFFALIPTLYKQIKKAKSGNVKAMILALFILSAAPAAQASDYNNFLDLYDGLLQDHVYSVEKPVAFNGVDYDGWQNDIRHEKAVSILTNNAVPDFDNQDHAMAFWINAYNILTIDLINKENERDSIKNLGSLFTSPWKKHHWIIGEQKVTVDQIEHEILRPMGDARIHFAINCASISCPDLRAEAYRPDTLDKQLDDQIETAFDNTGKILRMNKDSSIVYVSKIFDWFDEDFNNGDVRQWLIDSNAPNVTSQSRIQYLPYDWALNHTESSEK